MFLHIRVPCLIPCIYSFQVTPGVEHPVKNTGQIIACEYCKTKQNKTSFKHSNNCTFIRYCLRNIWEKKDLKRFLFNKTILWIYFKRCQKYFNRLDIEFRFFLENTKVLNVFAVLQQTSDERIGTAIWVRGFLRCYCN